MPCESKSLNAFCVSCTTFILSLLRFVSFNSSWPSMTLKNSWFVKSGINGGFTLYDSKSFLTTYAKKG